MACRGRVPPLELVRRAHGVDGQLQRARALGRTSELVVHDSQRAVRQLDYDFVAHGDMKFVLSLNGLAIVVLGIAGGYLLGNFAGNQVCLQFGLYGAGGPPLDRQADLRNSILITIMAGLVGMAVADPTVGLQGMIWCAVAVAFGSATQDIALDAFRIESAGTEQQAALAATYQTGYRLAMIWAGAGVLWIAARAEMAGAPAYQQAAWRTAYLAIGFSLGGVYAEEACARAGIAKHRNDLSAAEVKQVVAAVEGRTSELERARVLSSIGVGCGLRPLPIEPDLAREGLGIARGPHRPRLLRGRRALRHGERGALRHRLGPR